MKRILIGFGTLLLAATMGVMAQNPGGGAGRCCDTNNDGKCDRCGRAVGQGRGQGQGQGRRMGRGCGRGCCRNSQQSQTPTPAPAPGAPDVKK